MQSEKRKRIAEREREGERKHIFVVYGEELAFALLPSSALFLAFASKGASFLHPNQSL